MVSATNLALECLHDALIELLETPGALLGHLFEAALIVLGRDPLE